MNLSLCLRCQKAHTHDRNCKLVEKFAITMKSSFTAICLINLFNFFESLTLQIGLNALNGFERNKREVRVLLTLNIDMFLAFQCTIEASKCAHYGQHKK